jgi:hypothetical protein
MWHFIGVALGTVAVTGLVGTGVGVGYYLGIVTEREKD